MRDGGGSITIQNSTLTSNGAPRTSNVGGGVARTSTTPGEITVVSSLIAENEHSFGYDDRTWIDHFGFPHSDQMRLEERYKKAAPDKI